MLALLEALEPAWKNIDCYHPIRPATDVPSLN